MVPGQCYVGDCRDLLKQMAAAGLKAQTCVTSPPYWGLRDYGAAGQIGLEPTLAEWLATMVEVLRLVRDVLADDGTLWLNLGDSYASAGGSGWQGKNGQRADRRFTATRNTVAMREISRRPPHGLKPKDLIGQPWRLAFALQADGWYLRSDIIWHKPNPMPESVTDRPTKSHEYLFLLSKSERYYYDADAIKEPASPESHARYMRGRSDSHKYADGGPGGQTIARSFEHMRKPKPVAGWASGDTEHSAIAHAKPGSRRRKLAPDGSGTKNNRSFDEAMAVMPDRRNKRSVWTIATEAFSGAHFATFPRALIEPCVLAGSRPGDVVLDPFLGSGTTAQVAEALGRQWIGFEVQEGYLPLQRERLASQSLALPLSDGR